MRRDDDERSAPRWRAILEARWRVRLQKLTELSLAYHAAAAGRSRGQGARRLLRRAVAARRRMADTEDALGRVAAGDFGRCEQCAALIPEMLLAAAPESRYCVRCTAGAAGGAGASSAAGAASAAGGASDSVGAGVGPPMSALDSLQVDSALSYLIAIVIPALDAIFPVLPSESAVIALGVTTAGSTDPRIALLVGCAAVGAFLGDNLCYLLGRRFGPAVQRRFFATPKGARARAWAERSLERFGTQLIIVCRFIPGGRTAVTLTCGLAGYPRRSFVAATAVAAVIWALYAFLIGRLGGQAFEDKPWAGLVVAFGASIAISALVEAIRRLSRRGAAGAGPRQRRSRRTG